MQRLTLLLFIVLASSTLALSQRSTEAGVFLGVSNYMGDLSPSPVAANETQLAFGGQYRYMIRPKIGLKSSVSFAKISGSDINKPVENPSESPRRWSMEAGLLEFAIQAEWHLLGRPRFSNTGLYERQFSPYLGLGLGLTFAEAEVQTGGRDMVRFPEADDSSTFITFPITLGMRFDLSEYLIMSAEFGLRATLSDYLDGVSQNGNPDANDHYLMGGISLFYLIEAEYGERAAY